MNETPLVIAQIMGKMNAGGVESVVMNYYRHIDKEKIQFDFIVDEDSAFIPHNEIEQLGGRVFTIPPYHKPVAYHKALVNLLAKNRYKIIHSHINTLSVFPLFAAKCAGVPIRIAHNHSVAGKGETSRNIMKYALRPFSKLFPTHFCACAEHAGRWLFGNKLYDIGKVQLVSNAVDMSKFDYDAEARLAIRTELNIDDKFVVGHVGRFVFPKNHLFLIDIFAQLHSQRRESVLLLVGDGELEQEIRSKVEQLNLTDCVLFLGVRNDVHRILQGMDVFLLPSLYEGLPVVSIEAQASGLRLVASNQVPAEANITNGIEYVDLIKSATEWAGIILHSSANDRESTSRKILESNYNIKIAAKQLEEFYQQTINV